MTVEFKNPMKTPRSPFECPVCGALVPRGAKACPACGADERSGWNEEETRYDGLDIPDQEEDLRPPPGQASCAWKWVAALLLLLFFGYLLKGLF